MTEKVFHAVVAHGKSDRTLARYPLRLYCEECGATVPNGQLITEPPAADDPYIEASEVCFKCGESLWKNEEAA